MPRDLFAEIGDSPKPASSTSTGRDLFAELDAAPPAKKPGLVERAGDFVTSTLGGVTQTMLDNASSGTFRRDAAQEDGVLDRLGSLVERGGAAVDQGLYNFISATTGSKEAARRAKILEEGTTGQEVAGPHAIACTVPAMAPSAADVLREVVGTSCRNSNDQG